MVTPPPPRKKWWLLAGLALGALGGVGVSYFVYWFLKPPATVTGTRFERGRAEAERLGCFLCHGPEGRVGTTNFVPDIDEVPAWSQGNFALYVKTPDEVREWILDGIPARMQADPEEATRVQQQLIKMPAYRGLVSSDVLADLEFYVTTAGLLLPQDEESKEAKGRSVAIKLGCFSCHGPEGRMRAHNEGSLKGYIPSWDSSDYEELVKNEGELKEWVLDGAPRRLSSNPAASYFLTRQVVKMPAYKGRITDEELGELVAYVNFVRARK